MNERRIYKGLRVAKFVNGYVQFVDPQADGAFWYMHGEDFNTPYCVIEFR